MAWHLAVWYWLAHAALGGALFLSIGCLAVRFCRQPVRRLRLIELTLLGSLLTPWLGGLPGLPHYWTGLLPSPPPTEPVAASQPGESEPGASSAEPPGPVLASPLAATPAPASPSAAPLPAAPAPLPAPATAPDLDPLSAQTAPRWIVLAYSLAAAGLFLWWLCGVANLWHLHRTAVPAPRPVVELFRAIAGRAGDGVRLLMSDRLELPVMSGWWRPAILLPANLCRGGDPAALRYCLAHEWSHVERRDVWTWHLATLAQFLFFYQPLFWWLRRQLRLCQDYLADARAAEQAGMAEDYAAYLVRVAHHRLRGPALAALGLGDRRSNLYRRVLMLVQNQEPLERRCQWIWNLATTVGAIGLLAAVSAVRLDAGDAPKAPKADPPKESPKPTAKETKKEQTLTYTGLVKDKDTSKPVAGATVTVRRSVNPDPKTRQNRIIEETKHTTDAKGKYTFTIPPEQVAEPRLYIELDVEHPDFASQLGFGYALGMILKNEKLGERPFFENIELRRGKPVTGTVETPDGKPAAGIAVLAYSVTNQAGTFEYGSFTRTKTDAQGRFRVVMTTPGDGIFWLLPDKYAPSTHAVGSKRGDMGIFGLQKGLILKGRVLDAQGKPMAKLNVNAERVRQPNDDQILNRVADAIGRSAFTNDKGEFEMAPLPPGQYQVKPDEWQHHGEAKGGRLNPVPAVFLPEKVTLKEGETPEPMEVVATPHVTLEAQYVDSKGKPRSGHEFHIFGQRGTSHWFGSGRPDANGHIVMQAPLGLQNVQLNLMTNEHSVLRFRKSLTDPLTNETRINLGTLKNDVRGMIIVRYEAPILLVNAVDKDKHQIKDFKPQAVYGTGKSPKDPNSFFINGIKGDVHFEHQDDGRWRSSQLLPDEDLTLTVGAEGYEPQTQKLKLAEGAKKEIEVVLQKKK
jgi:uncharacterized GH25 family protein